MGDLQARRRMTIFWPKIIKLDDVVDALDQLAEQVATNKQNITEIIAARDATITHLQHDLEEHKLGAVERQAEIDRLKAQVDRQAWYARTGRKP